jgi:SAM-dependent methyltransferase
MNESKVPMGYDAIAYSQRVKGYSPEPIKDALWDLVEAELGGVVLDAGSGEGGWIKRLQQHPLVNSIISVDIVDDGASQIPGIDFYQLDLSKDLFPCGEESLDWIFAVEVLEHLANPRHFIQQAYRSLKKGGKFVATTPCNDSLTAKLSFLFRGYFPAFCDHDYQVAGHITPITELDIYRMSAESGFCHTDCFYPLKGRMPKTAILWQSIFPFLHGKLWSETLFVVLSK